MSIVICPLFAEEPIPFLRWTATWCDCRTETDQGTVRVCNYTKSCRFFSKAVTPTAFVDLLYWFVVAIFCLITMSARSRGNSNLSLKFVGIEIESQNIPILII